MARQRFIHPEIWDDPDLGRVAPLAFILYVGCFSNADDDGRLLGDIAYLKSQVFRYRDVTLDEVLQARSELTQACRSFVVYKHKSVEYVCFLNWDKYQKPRFPKPSKLPPPPGFKRRKARAQAKRLTVGATVNGTEGDTVEATEDAREWVGFGLGSKDKEGLGLPTETPNETTAPAALPGVAVGATGTRSRRPHGFECPHCGIVKAGPLSLEEHIANVHFDAAA